MCVTPASWSSGAIFPASLICSVRRQSTDSELISTQVLPARARQPTIIYQSINMSAATARHGRVSEQWGPREIKKDLPCQLEPLTTATTNAEDHVRVAAAFDQQPGAWRELADVIVAGGWKDWEETSTGR